VRVMGGMGFGVWLLGGSLEWSVESNPTPTPTPPLAPRKEAVEEDDDVVGREFAVDGGGVLAWA